MTIITDRICMMHDDLDFDAVFSYFNEADAERIINALINGKSVPADLQPLYQKAIQRNK